MSIVIIPAYNPDKKLIKVIEEISNYKIDEIIVVNDGSNEKSNIIFNRIKNSITLLVHDKNYGKGVAIKTALKYIKEKNITNKILIIDADGQHKIKDGMKILKELNLEKKELVLGKRSFEGKIPIKSKIGNILTRYIFTLFTGHCIKDTQTGLRAFGSNLIDELINIEGSRYEYETNMLIYCTKNKVEIKEVDIETIYIDKNNSSHFRAVIDSIRIYSTLILFAGSSFLSFLIDYISFLIIFAVLNNLAISNIFARILSGSFNFYLNSKIVFKQNTIKVKQILQYIFLAVIIIILNTQVLSLINKIIENIAISKIMTEIILFLISYVIQKVIVFRKES